MQQPRLTICDTMNFWIENARDEVLEVFRRVDVAAMNDAELRQLTGEPNLAKAATEVLTMGPQYLIIKKGEYGSMMCDTNGDCFILPGFPTAVVIDPTGAGDSFAGGMMGHLCQAKKVDIISLRNAMVCGTVTASFTIGDFSIHGIKAVSKADIDERIDTLRKVTQF